MRRSATISGRCRSGRTTRWRTTISGTCCCGSGSPTKRSSHFRDALRLDPSNAEAHYNAGSVLRARGDLAGALGEFRQAVHLKPDSTRRRREPCLAAGDGARRRTPERRRSGPLRRARRGSDATRGRERAGRPGSGLRVRRPVRSRDRDRAGGTGAEAGRCPDCGDPAATGAVQAGQALCSGISDQGLVACITDEVLVLFSAIWR